MKTTDPLFESIYNQTILQNLENRFGPIHRHHVDLPASGRVMLNVMDKMSDKGRRGEVVMVLPNAQGHIWLHTKAFYPAGIYRLMTGGLDAGETPNQALEREVVEETGFKTKTDRCLAVITYTFTANDIVLPFVSYVFLTHATAGRPQATDPEEAITNFRSVPAGELADIAAELRSIKGDFADWGVFRAVAHQVVWDRLQQ